MGQIGLRRYFTHVMHNVVQKCFVFAFILGQFPQIHMITCIIYVWFLQETKRLVNESRPSESKKVQVDSRENDLNVGVYY